MNALANIKSRLPDWAKDIRLNLDATIARSSLEPRLAVGAALAAAYAARSPELVAAFRDPEALDARHAEGALTAAALMGMNNVWYPFVEMAGDPDLKTMRAELRMNAYATHGGVDKVAFDRAAPTYDAMVALSPGYHEQLLGAARSLLERLSSMLLREPEDRGQLVELLHGAFEKNLLDADALSMIDWKVSIAAS